MTDGFSFKTRSNRDEFWEWVLWTFICISCQCAERFKFTQSSQPAGDRSTVTHTPSLNSQHDLRLPQQKESDRNKQLVLRGFQKGDPLSQSSDLLRRRQAIGL